MLPNHAPLKVAEAFKMLESLHPGRVDLGIGRAPGTDQATALALRGSPEAPGADDFPAQLADLFAFGSPKGVPMRAGRFGAAMMVTAVPTGVSLPPVWLLGSSDYSAHLAAQLGLGFGFAAHFSDFPPEAPMLAYRDEFRPGAGFTQPHAILTLSVICAPTDAEAERLASSLFVAFARLRTGQSSMLLPPEQALQYRFSPAESAVVQQIRSKQIIGAPDTVTSRIQEISARTMADEVMISTFIHGHSDRMRSYELLADAFSLSSAPELGAHTEIVAANL